MKFSGAAVLVLGALLLTVPAHAEPKKDIPASKDAAMEREVEAGDNPHLAKLDARSRELSTKLDKFALAHLYTLREAFGVLQAVRIVERDVGTAVKACAKANPDMKGDLNDRFASWTAKVDPVVKDKQNLVDSAIADQTYLPAKDVRDYLKLIEKTADHANKGIEKNPLTDEKSCLSLKKSMDRTQDVVSELLGEMALLPWPPEDRGAAAVTRVPN